ncbi:G-protein coupled receptors family 1 profile domain-containing protein [Caenorhabditis elegans]|uniref:G-protein coupled receptors family 1 profile domain-containing protein n=1 Tax=Caenorhabditis elegans TaxID=6239 RepID=Q965U4_CAEEL|nr:G-protein coupled receptors family 1 profile domain-containing protein [Caenorhabditis elegans]CCD72460.1 G-protein coupled receptors family 1 profile domain-containing protein [Caenorhabditis elegans]|eukprot:NP_503296.1 Serpentine Receptor, class X [Caenorhabditis elegans]
MEFPLKPFLGFLFGLLSGISLILNLITIIAVFRLAFCKRKNPVYIVSFFNILSDVFQVSAATFYSAPSIITSSFLTSFSKTNTLNTTLSSIFLFLWYFETILQVVMGLNRYVIICLQKHKIFTFRTTILLIVLSIPVSLGFMFKSQYWNLCCTFVYDHNYLSYSYNVIEGVANSSNNFDVPLNALSSVVSAFFYVMIFWTVHKSTPNSSTGEEQKLRRERDVKYAFQFCLLLIFYICAWSLFRILPLIIANHGIEWFVLIPMFYTLNCTSNAIIYLGFNSEVQENLKPQKLQSILRILKFMKPEPSFQDVSLANATNASSVAPIRHVALRFVPKKIHQPFRSIGVREGP